MTDYPSVPADPLVRGARILADVKAAGLALVARTGRPVPCAWLVL